MLRIFFACVGVVFALLTGARTAQSAPPLIYSAGTLSCGTWTADTGKPEHGYLEAWVDGYISAWSMAGAIVPGGKELAPTDRNAIKGFMNNYCSAHPLEKIHQGAYQLVLELIERSPRR